MWTPANSRSKYFIILKRLAILSLPDLKDDVRIMFSIKFDANGTA